MEYKLVVSGSRIYLEKKVAELLAEGWRPLGGIAMAAAGGEVSLAQAFIKTGGESQEWQKRYRS